MVMAGQSVHLATFFLGKLDSAVNQYFENILSLVTDNKPFLNHRKGGQWLLKLLQRKGGEWP